MKDTAYRAQCIDKILSKHSGLDVMLGLADIATDVFLISLKQENKKLTTRRMREIIKELSRWKEENVWVWPCRGHLLTEPPESHFRVKVNFSSSSSSSGTAFTLGGALRSAFGGLHGISSSSSRTGREATSLREVSGVFLPVHPIQELD
jgi:hypothetical protein